MTRRPILQLHVLLAVMLIYFGLYGAQSEFPRSVWSIAAYGAAVAGGLAGLILTPAAWWNRQAWVVGVFLGDLAFTTAALYVTQGFQGDLYLMYFLVILMAGLANSIRTSLVIGGLAGTVYLVGAYGTTREGDLLTPVLLMRVPFLFVVALICSYFARRVGHEQILRREAQHMGRLLHQQVREVEESLLEEQRKSEFTQAEWREAAQSVKEWQGRFDGMEQRLRDVLQSTHDLVVVLALDGRIVDVNRRVQTILGVSPATVIGRPFQAWVDDPAMQEGLAEWLADVHRSKKLSTKAWVMRTAQGDAVHLEWTFSGFRTPQGASMIQGLGAVVTEAAAADPKTGGA